MKVNSREKFLLIILAATVILLGGFKLLIEPKLKSFSETKAEFAEALQRKQTAEQNIANEKHYEKSNMELAVKIDEFSEPFFAELQSDKMQLFFELLADKAAITYNTITIGDKLTTQIAIPGPSAPGLSYPMKDAATELDILENGDTAEGNNSTPPAENKGNEQPKDLVEMMSVTVNFEATYEQALKYIDEIKGSGKTLRITSLTMIPTDTGSGNIPTDPDQLPVIQPEEDVSVVLSAECFGVVKLSGEEDLENEKIPDADGRANPFYND